MAMAVLGDVFDSLKAMSLLQLLLAFAACIGYALAQGSLVGPRGRRVAWALTASGAAGFAIQSTEWMHATVLIAFAVAGLGLFVATVCLTSGVLGFARSSTPPPGETPLAATALHPGATRARSGDHSGHAHSV
jgi:hypothetical protein